MWNCQGKPHNIKTSLLGKITRKKWRILSRHSSIYVCEKLDVIPWFYAGIISSEEGMGRPGFERIPCIFGLKHEDLSTLKEGDIVVLEPNGKVNVVWDINSGHNSILITEECNSSCIMCPQPRRKDPEGLLQFNLKLIKLININKTERIGLTGGEPTLHEENLIRIIKACKKRAPGVQLSLLTNGRRFKNLDFIKRLIDIGHPDLLICIPLYADNDREHDRIVGVKGSFYETIRGLQNLALFRQKIEIRNVIHALTYRRLPQFGEFVYHNFPFAIHIALMGMETTGLAFNNLKTLWVDPIEYMTELKIAATYLHRRDMTVSIYNLQLCILPQELWRFSKKSISDWKNIFLDECQDCNVRKECCGFFGTSDGWHSKYIRSV